MSSRRGRPPGARLPSGKDLKTPKIGQFFHQQPFAPAHGRRCKSGCWVSALLCLVLRAKRSLSLKNSVLPSLRSSPQGVGSQYDHVDLTGGSGFQEIKKERIHATELKVRRGAGALLGRALQKFPNGSWGGGIWVMALIHSTLPLNFSPPLLLPAPWLPKLRLLVRHFRR